MTLKRNEVLTAVGAAFGEHGELDNATLYAAVRARLGIEADVLNEKVPVGAAGTPRSLGKRTIRWSQQSLKFEGMIAKAEGKRGTWRITEKGRQTLTPAKPRRVMIAWCTRLGVALWADARSAFAGLDEPIHLCLTSPPYCLSRPRHYGNPPIHEYVDFLCETLEHVIGHLADGASLCLNVGQDVFVPGTPARSTYIERLVIALEDRFGLSLVDRLIWFNKSKAPGPVRYASLERVQLNVGYEPILWFTNNPLKLRSDNRRVLQPHSERHQKLMAAGGEQREKSYADGRYTIKTGKYGKPTPGRIPKNVLEFGHRCPDQSAYKSYCRAQGLPVHGAVYPLRLAEFMVQLMSREGDLVVDPFAGSFTTAKAAELNGRRWYASELMLEYVFGASSRFSDRINR